MRNDKDCKDDKVNKDNKSFMRDEREFMRMIKSIIHKNKDDKNS